MTHDDDEREKATNQAHPLPVPVMGCECVVCSGRQIKQHNDAVSQGQSNSASFGAEYYVDAARKATYERIAYMREEIDRMASNKSMPVCTGFIDYFPDAIREVSKVSLAGNKQHGIDGPLRWDRSKSADHADSLMRHQMLRGTFDADGQRHSAKVLWRAAAQLQVELEQEKAAQSSV